MSDPQQPDPAKKPTTEPGSGTADEVTGPIPTGPFPTGADAAGTGAEAGSAGAGSTGRTGSTATDQGDPGGKGDNTGTQDGKGTNGDTGTTDDPGTKNGKGGKRQERPRTNPWLIVGAVAVALVVLAGLGYFSGLGPLNRLSTERGIDPPAKLAGFERITDPKTRSALELERTREDLVRINKGKEATVEAYSNQKRDRIFVVVALRGRVDRDKYLKDTGVSAEQVKTIGNATCVTPQANVSTQCYRGSNTLTVIVQAANEDVSVDAVAPVTAEAFEQMK